jgi:regulatory protein
MASSRRSKPLTRERAWDYALWLLGRRAYTSAEIRERLRRRALPEDDAERIVRRLEELRLVDDGALAHAFVAQRSASHGRFAHRQALRRRGVPEPLIDAALGEPDDDDGREAAEALLHKHAWRFASSATREAGRAKAFAMLARRGFPPDAAREAVEAVLPRDEE